METIIEGSKRTGFAIPTTNERHDDEFHVSVRLSNRETKCYHTENTDGWKGRVRSFVYRKKREADCRIDTVTISHVKDGTRLSRKKWGLRFRDGSPSFIEL